MDESIVKFNELSIIDGIDEILAHIIEIEQMIDNKNSVKNRLLIVQKKLKNTRTKCNKRDIDNVKITHKHQINIRYQTMLLPLLMQLSPTTKHTHGIATVCN